MSAYHHFHWIERHGYKLRQCLGLSTLAVLDPFKLAKALRVALVSPDQFEDIPSKVRSQLLEIDCEGWSAMCFRLPTGASVTVYNPIHAVTRIRATVMEELSHLYFKHQGTSFITSNGGVFRTYNKKEERDAYWTGAAALLPAVVLERARKNKMIRHEIAREYGVSEQLVRMRENLTHNKLVG